MRSVSIKIGNLSLLVHQYQFPDSNDYWDGNWLVLDAHCESETRCVHLSKEPCLRTVELIEFVEELKLLHAQERNQAKLRSLEPYLGIEVSRNTRGDALMVTVSIMPKYPPERHFFQFDQKLADAVDWITEIGSVIEAFPARGRD